MERDVTGSVVRALLLDTQRPGFDSRLGHYFLSNNFITSLYGCISRGRPAHMKIIVLSSHYFSKVTIYVLSSLLNSVATQLVTTADSVQ